MKKSNLVVVLGVCGLLSACSSPQRLAPIVEHSMMTSSSSASVVSFDANAATYTVQPGDTLFQISRKSGKTIDQLKAWNQLANANDIKVGQVLNLKETQQSSAPKTQAVTQENVQAKPLNQTQQKQDATKQTPVKQEAAKPADNKIKVGATVNTNATREVDGIKWSWPTNGKVSSTFGAQKNKGVDISGVKGQKITSAADGTVYYSGNMSGYGKLVVVKHSPNILSAYAYNSKIVVKEGQKVTRGQTIATMGANDTGKTRLHFEVRQMSKPVDPARYLP